MKEEYCFKSKRIVYYDILNILAIFAVIALHCNVIVHGNPNVRAWDSSLIIECVFYFAVPLFCMLSGATLMNYRIKYNTKVFFKKRIIKVLIPFCFWSFIMFIWKHLTYQINLNDYKGISGWLNAIFSNKEEATYYFLFLILGIYLTMPLLSLLTKKEYVKTLWLTVLLYFIFNSFLPNILSLWEIKYNSDFSIQLSGYIIFVILGYLFSTQKIQKKYRLLIYFAAVLGLLYRFFTTYFFSKQMGSVVKITWGYTTWHSILLASAVFLFVKYLNIEKWIQENQNIHKIFAKLSSCSFGIYLIHQIIIYYLVNIFQINVYCWEWRTLGVIITYSLSLIIILVLKKNTNDKKFSTLRTIFIQRIFNIYKTSHKGEEKI